MRTTSGVEFMHYLFEMSNHVKKIGEMQIRTTSGLNAFIWYDISQVTSLRALLIYRESESEHNKLSNFVIFSTMLDFIQNNSKSISEQKFLLEPWVEVAISGKRQGMEKTNGLGASILHGFPSIQESLRGQWTKRKWFSPHFLSFLPFTLFFIEFFYMMNSLLNTTPVVSTKDEESVARYDEFREGSANGHFILIICRLSLVNYRTYRTSILHGNSIDMWRYRTIRLLLTTFFPLHAWVNCEQTASDSLKRLNSHPPTTKIFPLNDAAAAQLLAALIGGTGVLLNISIPCQIPWSPNLFVLVSYTSPWA